MYNYTEYIICFMIELKGLWSDSVNMSQAHMTKLRKKEELITQLKHDSENIHQYQLKIEEINKQLDNSKKQEQRKEEELLQVNLDSRGKDEKIKEMKTREISLEHKIGNLKQSIL